MQLQICQCQTHKCNVTRDIFPLLSRCKMLLSQSEIICFTVSNRYNLSQSILELCTAINEWGKMKNKLNSTVSAKIQISKVKLSFLENRALALDSQFSGVLISSHCRKKRSLFQLLKGSLTKLTWTNLALTQHFLCAYSH